MDADSLGLIIQDLAVEVEHTNYGAVRLPDGALLPIEEFACSGKGDQITEHALCVYTLREILRAMPSNNCKLFLRWSPEYERQADEVETRHRMYARLAWHDLGGDDEEGKGSIHNPEGG